MRLRFAALLTGLAIGFASSPAWAADGGGGHGGAFPLVFLFLVLMLVFARIGALTERFGQPAVLGELIMGVALAAIAAAPAFGWIGTLRHDGFVRGVAEIGVILLLFRTGLESNVREMARVGTRAFLVASIGVALPFIGGYFVSRLLMPGHGFETYLFIGATLTATSVGITARVFKDLGLLKSLEAKIVLGAAVIDDVLGLMILAMVSGIVSTGSVEPAAVVVMSLKALAFLAGSIAVGQALAPRIGGWFSRIHGGAGMKMALALLFCGAFAYGASELAGLAPIVGAFAAGLVLDPVHFRGFAAPRLATKAREWAERAAGSDKALSDEMRETAEHEDDGHVEQLIDGVSNFFVPIFFVYTGLQIDLSTFADPGTLGIALTIASVAFAGKILCGWAAGRGTDRLLVGFGMVPRGEVGLIFANVGKQLGVVDDRAFAVILIVVIMTTLLTPPILGALVKKKSASSTVTP